MIAKCYNIEWMDSCKRFKKEEIERSSDNIQSSTLVEIQLRNKRAVKITVVVLDLLKFIYFFKFNQSSHASNLMKAIAFVNFDHCSREV